MCTVLLQATGAVLLADFFSGLVHWAEDAYARKDTPVIGKWIGEANIEHHIKPRAFVSRNWWESSWDLALISVAVIAGAWWLKLLSWHVWLFALVTANANQVHKWAHSAPHENGRLVTWLHKLKLIQTQRHHARHHSGAKDSHYCSVTNFLNPLLEELEFWKGLERMNEKLFGLKRKPDPTVKVTARTGAKKPPSHNAGTPTMVCGPSPQRQHGEQIRQPELPPPARR